MSTVAILPLSSLGMRDLPAVGGKAARLGALLAAGFPVPDGFVLPVEAHRRGAGEVPEDVRAALLAGAEALGGPLAVRSSAVDEDRRDASFAGQYTSVLGVRAEGLEAAVARCWASAEAPGVRAYRADRGEHGDVAMAVLVQRLVPAEAAGVALTADPVTGERDRVVISAVRGLGERLVGGEADADEWVVTAHGATRRRGDGAIDGAIAREVADLARRVEAHFGEPQDVEWARVAGRTWLVQARPITALPDVVRWEAPPGGWGRHLRLGEWLGEPVTPLFESWLLTRMERRMFANYDAIGGSGPVPEPLHAVVNGWYYMNFDLLPKSPRAALAMLARFLWKLVRNPRRTLMVVPPLTWIGVDAMVDEWRGTLAPAYAAAIADAEARLDAGERDPDALVGLVDGLADHAGDWFTSISFVAGHAWKREVALARFFAANLRGRVEGAHHALLAGLCRPFHVAHAVYSLDWFHPTAGKAGVPSDAGAEARRTELEARARAFEEACRAALPSRRRATFDRLLAGARRFGPIREEQAAGLTAAWPVMRRVVRRIGEGLVARGVLGDVDDVWFLRREELAASIRIDTTGRRAAWARQRRLAAPLVIGDIPAPIRRVIDEGEALFRTTDALGAGVLRGLGASPGRVTATARVVRTPEEFDRLGVGEVLVAPATTPAWTLLFARAAAVVTDTGSPLAHASLVAREYGIPAVVGTGDATARLVDGERITVDGVRGVVERVG